MLLLSTIRQTRWYSSLFALLILLTITTKSWDEPISYEAQASLYKHDSEIKTAVALKTNIAPSFDNKEDQLQVKPAEANIKTTFKERMATIKSVKELMEKNKLFPLLHDDISQFQTVEVVATGYYAGHESTGKTPGHPEYGVTYSGVQVRRDVFSTIAADTKLFPLGTLLWIPGYGYAVVADTGSAIKGKKIDLYYETKEQVFKEWGKKKVNVFVVEQGKGKLTEEMINQLNSLL